MGPCCVSSKIRRSEYLQRTVARRIHVRESVNGPLKDGDSRIVPVLDALLPILTECLQFSVTTRS